MLLESVVHPPTPAPPHSMMLCRVLRKLLFFRWSMFGITFFSFASLFSARVVAASICWPKFSLLFITMPRYLGSILTPSKLKNIWSLGWFQSIRLPFLNIINFKLLLTIRFTNYNNNCWNYYRNMKNLIVITLCILYLRITSDSQIMESGRTS